MLNPRSLFSSEGPRADTGADRGADRAAEGPRGREADMGVRGARIFIVFLTSELHFDSKCASFLGSDVIKSKKRFRFSAITIIKPVDTEKTNLGFSTHLGES